MISKAILAAAIILVSSVSLAFSINSRYAINEKGAYIKETQVLCDMNEAEYCQVLCKQDNECRRTEPYCLNCAGTTSTVLRTLFSQISQNYVPTQTEIPTSAIVRYLATTNYILIGAKSVYNYYKPLNSGEFLSNLQALCPTPTDDPLLAIKLSPVQEPEKMSFILCKSADGRTQAFDVSPRQPGLGNQVLGSQIKLSLQ
ncbi:hypothetical protein [Bdellovibrio svalbardensis]|uniref:Uncharacterized protein n=1 Tax=Bdellovibrio svalbardensis TaxID=2972972 RepID=A0ABT6DDH9_9BACT|nr:hypothetical protein [Bdellovibrio svalbardensis]MDG0814896.1 hypothetical protein [Bdellovibrio svalbardensis]